MKAIPIKDGILHIADIKDPECPHCSRIITFSEIENKWMSQDNHTIKIKCKCKRFIGVAQNIIGDFVLFEL